MPILRIQGGLFRLSLAYLTAVERLRAQRAVAAIRSCGWAQVARRMMWRRLAQAGYLFEPVSGEDGDESAEAVAR